MEELGPGDVTDDGGVMLEHGGGGGDDDAEGNAFLEADDT